MSIKEIISRELAPYRKKKKVRLFKTESKPIREETIYTQTFHYDSKKYHYDIGGAENPNRFELNTMRKRLDRHRRWIQIGILVGSLSFGIKAYDYVTVDKPIEEVVTSEYVYGGVDDPHPAFIDLPASVQKKLGYYRENLPIHAKNVGYVAEGYCIDDKKMQGCYSKNSPDPDRKQIYEYLIENVDQ